MLFEVLNYLTVTDIIMTIIPKTLLEPDQKVLKPQTAEDSDEMWLHCYEILSYYIGCFGHHLLAYFILPVDFLIVFAMVYTDDLAFLLQLSGTVYYITDER